MKQKVMNKKGFTLVELMIVVVIIGILAAIAIPMYSSYTNKSKTKAAQADLKNIFTAIDTYKQEHGVYPSEPKPTEAISDWDTKYKDYTFDRDATGQGATFIKRTNDIGGKVVSIDAYGSLK